MRSLLVFGVIFSLVCGYSYSKLQSQAELTKIWIANQEKLSVEKGVNAYNTPNANQIKYFLYTRLNAQAPQLVEPNVESIAKSVYDPLKPTVFAIHGLGGSVHNLEIQYIIIFKLAQEDCNIIVVDHHDVPQATYNEGAANTPFVGEQVGRLIELLHKQFKVKLNQIHIIGSSMGGQIAGFTGQSVKKFLNQKVQRITGLDPAGPVFNEAQTDDEHLSADDARFVDVIHTNAGGIGYTLPCGHADYYPNGGSVQPGCSPDDISCSHARVIFLIPELWSPENKFTSARCASIEEFAGKQCTYLNNIKMGENDWLHGLFYLETNSEFPYGKGNPALQLS